jgi:hypothetical protein
LRTPGTEFVGHSALHLTISLAQKIGQARLAGPDQWSQMIELIIAAIRKRLKKSSATHYRLIQIFPLFLLLHLQQVHHKL